MSLVSGIIGKYLLSEPQGNLVKWKIKKNDLINERKWNLKDFFLFEIKMFIWRINNVFYIFY
jgi:hypothetical protein